MPYFLAIDAGGTQTRCALADESRVLARASTGTIKLQRVSEAVATQRLTRMLAEVATEAGVPLTRITRTCIGLAGVTIPAVREWAARTIAAHVAGELLLLGDEEIALDAAFPGSSGILLVAGTGSNCIGRAADGTLHRAGGYGPILGDAGGGYWIGLEALRGALRARDCDLTAHSSESVSSSSVFGSADAAAADALLAAIQQELQVASLGELIELGNRRSEPLPDFASLVPVIARSAEEGNAIASTILEQSGAELAALVTIVAAKMAGAVPADRVSGSVLRTAFVGSILAEVRSVHPAVAAELAGMLPAARLDGTPTDPLPGALYRARQS